MGKKELEAEFVKNVIELLDGTKALVQHGHYEPALGFALVVRDVIADGVANFGGCAQCGTNDDAGDDDET